MRKTLVGISLLLFIPLSGSSRFSRPDEKARFQALSPTTAPAAVSTPTRELQQAENASQLFASRQYDLAASLYRELAVSADRRGDIRAAARFRMNLGSVYLVTTQLQAAIQEYLQARERLIAARDNRGLAYLNLNLSSLYFKTAQFEPAEHYAQQALQIAGFAGEEEFRASLYAHLGKVNRAQGRYAEAEDFLLNAIESARRAGSETLEATAWDQLGQIRIEQAQWDSAAAALQRAAALREKLHSPDLSTTYRRLGSIRFEQKDYTGALKLFDRALALASGRSDLPVYRTYFDRGRAQAARGRYDEALADYRKSLALIAVDRSKGVASDSTRISLDMKTEEIWSELVEVCIRLFQRTGNERYAREAFEVAERHRAASLRQIRSGQQGVRRKLPAGYWSSLRQLERSEADLLRADSVEGRKRLAALRSELSGYEALAGGEAALEIPDLLNRTQAALPPDAVFFSFHVSGDSTRIWAVSHSGLAFTSGPGRQEIARLVETFAASVRKGVSGEPAGRQLFEALFGKIPPAFRSASHWILALDDQLFELPLAALPEPGNGSEQPLIAGHALRVVPSAASLLYPPVRRPEAGFLGVADPVYNRADSRWRPQAVPGPRAEMARALRRALFVSGEERPSISLGRLVASSREVSNAAREAVSGGQPVEILSGPSATKANVLAAIEGNRATIHFATHLVPSVEDSGGHALLALGLDPATGEPEFLSPEEIRPLAVHADLIVLSGCSSGAGQVWRGAGLSGMTRAWLAAGAGAVIASRWPVPDDSGVLFQALYRHLRGTARGDVAVALRLAQLDLMRSGGWRAAPEYWAAYFVIG